MRALECLKQTRGADASERVIMAVDSKPAMMSKYEENAALANTQSGAMCRVMRLSVLRNGQIVYSSICFRQ